MGWVHSSPTLSWRRAHWNRFCNEEQVQDWAEGKVELRCNYKLLLIATELGRPFNTVPNCMPGPVTNTGVPHQGGVIQDKVTPSLRVQSLEEDSAVSRGKEWVPGA